GLLILVGYLSQNDDNGEGLKINGYLILVFMVVCVLSSFGTIYIAILYTTILLVLLFSYMVQYVNWWIECDRVSFQNSLQIKIIGIVAYVMIAAGFVGALIMSIKYHWLIYKVGTDQKLCCITRCGGKCGCCLSCCLC